MRRRTQKQQAASRANGSKSQGATTVDGKARIVEANLITGIYAEVEVLPWEIPSELEKLTAEYHDHHKPQSPEARALVDDLVSCEWSLRRFRRADANLQAYSFKRAYTPDNHFCDAQAFAVHGNLMMRLQQRINATRMAFHRALKALHELEDRPPKPKPVPVPEPKAEPMPEPVATPAAGPVPATPTTETHLHVLRSLRNEPAQENGPVPKGRLL
jgi:hypothetical protein